MKRSRVPDGYYRLPCGVGLTVASERPESLTYAPRRESTTPSRAVVNREASELTGLPVWVENWPADDELLVTRDPVAACQGICYRTYVLDYDDQLRECRHLMALSSLLSELVELCIADDIGWAALGIDPTRLPTFGGDRPEVPHGFFLPDSGEPSGLPSAPLSWDATHLLLACRSQQRPFCVPRRPSVLFESRVAERCGLARCTDAEAFDALASALAWDGSYEPIGASGLQVISAKHPTGQPIEGDAFAVVVRESPVPWPLGLYRVARSVVAVGTKIRLRDPHVRELIDA